MEKIREVTKDAINDFPYQISTPDWFKRYEVLFKTRRTKRFFIAKNVHVPYIQSIRISGFKKIKVLGYKSEIQTPIGDTP